MTEKYSLLPSQSYPLTPPQTALQQLSEKHPVNTIQPPEIEYTQTSQALVPTDTPYLLSESIYNDSQTQTKLSKA